MQIKKQEMKVLSLGSNEKKNAGKEQEWIRLM